MTRYLLIVDFQPGAVDAPWRSGSPRRSRPTSTTTAPSTRARRQRRAGRVRGPGRPRPGQGRDLRRRHGAGRDRRTVPGVQGVDRRLPDRRRRVRGAGDRDRGALSAVPGQGGKPIQQPIQVRRIMDDAPSNAAEMDASSRPPGGVGAERPARRRGPAARAGAAGPWRAGPPLGRLRRGRGRRPGGADRRRRPLAARGHPGRTHAAGCADRGRAAHRPAAQRAGPPSRERETAVPASAPAAADPAAEDDTLTVLFMCCHPALTAGIGDRADPARGRRPDDRRDRAGLPRARGDDGAAHLARQAHDQGVRRPVPAAARADERPAACASCCACCT